MEIKEMKIDKQKLDEAIEWEGIEAWIYYGIDNGESIKNKNIIEFHKTVLAAAHTLHELLPHLEEMVKKHYEVVYAETTESFWVSSEPHIEEIINILEGKNNSN